MAAAHRRRVALVVAGVLVALPAAGAADARNPVFGGGAADPGVYVGDNGLYHVVSTSGFNGKGAIPWRTSSDLATWNDNGRMLPQQPGWALGRDGYWGPDLVWLDGIQRYAVYFAAFARAAVNDHDAFAPGGPGDRVPPSISVRCIGRAIAVTGQPFVPDGNPVVCNHGKHGSPPYNLIDPQLFTVRGKNFLLYKREDTNQIMIRTIAADGISQPGRPRVAIAPSLGWEHGNTEAPALVYNGAKRRYYLFYSGGQHWRDTYAVGVARAKRPLGPWTKLRRPILRGTGSARYCGVGGQDVTRTAAQGWLLWYHARTQGHASKPGYCGSTKRFLMKETLSWAGTWPKAGNGRPSR